MMDHRIERREFKYLLPPRRVEALRRSIQPFCRIDRFAAEQQRQNYLVESLYFDSPNLCLYFENQHKTFQRVKLRVRRYPDAPNAPVFLEVKQRSGDVIEKSRGGLSSKDWAPLLRSDDGAVLPQGKAGAAVERFLSLKEHFRAIPVVQVRYRREPWESTVDDYVRITFDTEISSATASELAFKDSDHQAVAIDNTDLYLTQQSLTLVELKFTQLIPLWLMNIVRTLELERSHFSKYVRGVRACLCPPQLRSPSGRGFLQ